jgi:uncharacterized membrane protein
MTQEMDRLIEKTIIIACIIGIIVAVFLIWASSQESYSSLYIYPDSYSNYVEAGDTVSFVYGVKSFETTRTKYNLQVYLGNELKDKKDFWLNCGETREEDEIITLPEGLTFPIKVKIVLEANGRAYDIHFWLNEKSA